MARIRSVKPEFFRSKKLAACSPRARLTFIGLWIFSDDEGRYEYEPELLKADLWPWEPDATPKEADACVAELVERGRLCMYEHGGKIYLHIVNWHEHQVISHKGKSRLPACPRELHGGPPEPSRGLRSLPEDSGESHESSGALQPDLGSRNRDLGSRISNTVVEQTRPDNDPITAVFDAWRDATGKHRARLDEKRRRKIKAALRGYPLAEVLDAVRGWSNSPHHRGENDQGTVYNELDLLLRDAAHIEQFRDLWRAGPPNGPPGKATLRMVRNARDMRAWAEQMEGGENAAERVGTSRVAAQRELPGPAD